MTSRTIRTALLAGVFAGGMATASYADGDIIIGMAVAQTGWEAAFDGDASLIAKIWIDQMNAKGGLLGKHIKEIEADTKTDKVEGAKAGQAMVDGGANIVLVTCDYDNGSPAASRAQKAGVISVFLCASDPKAGVAGVGPLSFTAGNAGQIEGAILGEWAIKNKGWKKGYVLLDETIQYDKSVCAGYDWDYPKVGGTIVGRDTFKNDDPSVQSQITRLQAAIKDKGVDNIMLCTYVPGGGSATRQIRAAGINLPILAATAMDGLGWESAVPGLKDFYVPVQAVASGDANEKVNEVTKAFIAKYGKAPSSQYAYPILAWLEAWEKAVTETKTTDAKTVVAKMETFKDEPTTLGPRTYTHKWHIQTDLPMTITELTEKSGKVSRNVVTTWRISDVIPDNVLLRINQ
jgi:branched-chain amino acid transport system substrate-binding protein